MSRIHINRDKKLEGKVSSRQPTCEGDFSLATESPDSFLNGVHKDNEIPEFLSGQPFPISALKLQSLWLIFN